MTPGEHTVFVSMWWHRSRLLPLSVTSGSQTDLTVGVRGSELVLKLLLPMFIAGYLALLAIKTLWRAAVIADHFSAYVLTIAVMLGTLGAYVVVTWMLSGDYWTIWTLDQSKTP